MQATQQQPRLRRYAAGHRRLREAERRQAGQQPAGGGEEGRGEEGGGVASDCAPGEGRARSPLEGVIRALTATRADEGSARK